jgi:hypothetical protein
MTPRGGPIAPLTLPPRPLIDPGTLVIAGCGALALTGLALVAAQLVPGLHVGFLLGGTGQGGAGKLGPFVGQIKGMAGPLAVVGAAVAVVGAIAGGILLAIGHPHGARMLGRVALGAVVIAAASTVVG